MEINREIICDGVNGFSADAESEWEEKLSALIVKTMSFDSQWAVRGGKQW